MNFEEFKKVIINHDPMLLSDVCMRDRTITSVRMIAVNSGYREPYEFEALAPFMDKLWEFIQNEVNISHH